MRFSNIFLWTTVYNFLAREAACKKGDGTDIYKIWNRNAHGLREDGVQNQTCFSPPPEILSEYAKKKWHKMMILSLEGV